MFFLRYWNTLLHKTCWGIHSVQVVQPQWEPRVELWVAGARGKRPGSGADPLHNKGHKSLWPCQRIWDTAGAQDSAGRPQTMARIRLWGLKSPGDPWGSLLWGTSLGCYSVGCTMKKLLKGSRGLRLLWETWVEQARKSCLTVGEWRESSPLWGDFGPSSVTLVVGVWLSGWLLGCQTGKVS